MLIYKFAALIVTLLIIKAIPRDLDGPDRFIRLGMVWDCRYCDQLVPGIHQYRLSLFKLRECIDTFNLEDLDQVFYISEN